jgi:hypothetical protein
MSSSDDEEQQAALNIDPALEAIYITAASIYKDGKLSLGEIYDLVKDGFDTMEITFLTAAQLDYKYFNCFGEFRTLPYHHPKVGDKIDLDWTVTAVGLLTFKASPPKRGYPYFYDADDYDD